MLGTQKMLRGHLLLVPLAVDLGLGSPVLDYESRTVPWYTRGTDYWQPLVPEWEDSVGRSSHESQDGAASAAAS